MKINSAFIVRPPSRPLHSKHLTKGKKLGGYSIQYFIKVFFLYISRYYIIYPTLTDRSTMLLCCSDKHISSLLGANEILRLSSKNIFFYYVHSLSHVISRQHCLIHFNKINLLDKQLAQQDRFFIFIVVLFRIAHSISQEHLCDFIIM